MKKNIRKSFIFLLFTFIPFSGCGGSTTADDIMNLSINWITQSDDNLTICASQYGTSTTESFLFYSETSAYNTEFLYSININDSIYSVKKRKQEGSEISQIKNGSILFQGMISNLSCYKTCTLNIPIDYEDNLLLITFFNFNIQHQDDNILGPIKININNEGSNNTYWLNYDEIILE